jgi:hypothetical protein
MMKGLAQLVVLVVMALLAGQPLLACTSCVQQGDGCAPVCCTAMSGMSDAVSMQMSAGCQTSMAAAPAESGCGQPVASLASLPRTAEPLALQAQSKIDSHLQLMRDVPFPAHLPADLATRWSNEPITVSSSRNILFQVFRI